MEVQRKLKYYWDFMIYNYGQGDLCQPSRIKKEPVEQLRWKPEV